MNWKKTYHVYRQLVNGKPLSFQRFFKQKEKALYLDKLVTIRFRKNNLIFFETSGMNSQSFKQMGKVTYYQERLLKEAKKIGLPVLTYIEKSRLQRKNIALSLKANTNEGEKIKELLEKYEVTLNAFYLGNEEFSVCFTHLKSLNVSWNLEKEHYSIGTCTFSSIEAFEEGFVRLEELSTRIGACRDTLVKKAQDLDPDFDLKRNAFYYGAIRVPLYLDCTLTKHGEERYRGFLGKQEEIKANSLEEFEEKLQKQLVPCYHSLRLRRFFA